MMSLPEIPALVPVAIEEEINMDYSLAIVYDNTVYQIMHSDGQTAALMLSNPTFIQVDRDEVEVGHVYDSKTKTFSKPKL
jgi:hypothetical protein